MILKEGGNIFKDADGKPTTTRISRDAVDPTLDWVEKVTGLKLKDNKLGSTGIKASSGDIDVAVDASKIDKEATYQKLVAWAQKNHPNDSARQWTAKSGTNVHFKTPINGNPANGFVQTDLMFGNPQWMKFALKGSGDGTIYKGSHRMIMLASLAKAQGMQWSPTKGLVNRETKEVITTDPEEIARRLIGPSANKQDLDSVENINKAIKTRKDYNELVADFKKNIEAQGLPMPENRSIRAGLMIAEKEYKPGLFKSTIGGLANLGKTAVAGFQAGRAAGGGFGAMSQAYKKAGGGQTTIGQVGDKLTTVGQTITGNQVKMILNPTMEKPARKIRIIAKNKVDRYKKAGWEVFDPKNKEHNRAAVGMGATDFTVLYRQKPDGSYQKIKVANKDVFKYTKQRARRNYSAWSATKPKGAVESVMNESARIQHIEDLVFYEGSRGAMRALSSLRNMASGGHKDVTIKWDGSPAVIFGRDEDGEFILTDKSGFSAVKTDGRAKSPEQLKDILLNRGGGKNKDDPGRIAFANNMAGIFDIFKGAVPKDFVGFFKGDLLYYKTPKIVDNNFVFKPNPGGVEYAVDVSSDLGKRIAKSETAVVIHRMVDIDGSESPLKDLGMFQGNDLLVVPPMSVETPPEVPNAEIERLAQIIKNDSADLDSLLDMNKLRTMKLTNFSDILYNYVNQSVDRGTLDSIGRDFMKWLMSHEKISEVKKNKIAQYIKQNMKAFKSLWEVVGGIMKVKNNIIAQLDSQAGSVKATTAGKPGGEGYVLAHPGGDMKLVNRAGFTAANRAVKR